MEERQITRAYNVEIKATEALKELAELELQVKDLQNAQKELRKEGKADSEEYVRMSQQIKGYKARQAELQKEIQTNIKLQNQESGSLAKMKAEASLLTAQLDKLADTEENLAKRTELTVQIKDLTDRLKEAEEAYGDNRRSVGDYAIAGRALTQELGEITDKLYELATAGQRGSEEYAELAQKAQELRKAQQAVDQEIEAGGSATKTIDGLTQAVGGVTAAYTVWQSATQVLGIENKDLEETMQKVIIATTALNALQQIQISLQKQSAVVILAKTVATKAAAAAQWLWNTAMAANPIGAIITVVAGLIGGITLLTKAFGNNEDAAKKAAQAMAEYEAKVSSTEAALAKINSEANEAAGKAEIEGKRQIEQLQKNHASKEAIAKAEADTATKLRDIEIDAAEKRAFSNQELAKSKYKVLESEHAILETLTPGSKKYEERAKRINELTKEYYDLHDSIVNDFNNAEKLRIEQIEADRKFREEQVNRAIEAYNKTSQAHQAYLEALLKAEYGYQKEDYASQAYYAQKLYLLVDKSERDRLAVQRKYGKITQKDYDNQLSILDLKYKNFTNGQITQTNKYLSSLRDSLKELAGKTIEEQISDINEKYAEAFKKLDNEARGVPIRIEGMSESEWEKIWSEYEDYLLAQGQLRLRLTKAQEKEIADVRYNERQKSKSDIDELIKREYEDDLAKFSDNEREKLRIESEMLQKRIEERKKAGYETGDLEAELRRNQTATAQLDLNADLLAAQNNAQAKYEARKAYLLKEKEIYADNADRQMQINADLAANEQELLDARLANLEQWASRSLEVAGALNDLFSAISDRQLQKAEEEAEAEKAILEDKLNKNLISQEQYDKQTEKIDKKLAKEQAKIERENAIRDKIMKTFQVITDTAVAIMAAWTNPWAAPGLIPIITATSAIQLATIAATPLPKASKGRLIDGPSHAGGGVPIEAEGGEVIINKKSSSAFLPLLSAINEAGGGVPFVRPLSDGGFAARYAMSGGNITKSELSQAIKDGFKDVKIIATVEDIRREEAHYINIENRANF